MLELQNISFSVDNDTGKSEILKDISLTVEDRKFTVITGPNGGGKTTLAKAIMGIGQIRVRPGKTWHFLRVSAAAAF